MYTLKEKLNSEKTDGKPVFQEISMDWTGRLAPKTAADGYSEASIKLRKNDISVQNSFLGRLTSPDSYDFYDVLKVDIWKWIRPAPATL